MRGAAVLVRAFNGELLSRRVWDVQGETVLICDEDRFLRLMAGDGEVHPIGFPKMDIFEFDEDVDAPGHKLKPWAPSNFE